LITALVENHNMGVKKNQSSVSEMLYDSENGTLLGRTAGSWARILGFYAVYYSFLACLFYGFLAFYKSNLPPTDRDGPVIKSRLDQPGAGVWPHNDFRDDRDNLEFNLKANEAEYVEYSKAFAQNYVDSSTFTNDNLPVVYNPGNVIQDIDFAAQAQKGEPVVFIALNKIIGWYPINRNSYPENLPANSFVKDSVYFDCYNVKDNEIVNDFKVVPYEGTEIFIESKWFNFNPAITSPASYKKPFVAMKVVSNGGDLKDGQNHQFKCRILADNIQGAPMDDWFNEQNDQAKVKVGSVTFGFSYN